MNNKNFLAFDLGAESGRAILGTFSDGLINTREIHRFPTGMLKKGDHYHWDIFRIYKEIIKGIKICVEKEKNQPDSVGIDTWGVDYALLAEDGSFLNMPFTYRDPRTNNIAEEVFALIPKKQIYDLTGIQFLQFNTIYQLYSEKKYRPEILKNAGDLLFIPDIFNFLLTGVKTSEFTFATTSQLFNPVTMDWEEQLFTALDLPKGIMRQTVMPGDIIGAVKPQICKETGIKQIPVIATASHDTGSAIAAIPATGNNWAYISSGTWSLMGIESSQPLICDKSFQNNFSNEGGVERTFRVLKNMMGLWILQQTKKAWEEKKYSYSYLVEMAEKAAPFRCMIDPDNTVFFNPDNMARRIMEYISDTNQETPSSEGEMIRTILESLALKSRFVLEQINDLAPERIEKIYMTGGGINNELLCQFTANATGLPLITTFAEGTALGNIMVQAMAMKLVNSLSEIRYVIGNSYSTRIYEPEDTEKWEEAYKKFNFLIKSGLLISAR